MRCDVTLDFRIDRELLALNQEATNLLPSFFDGTRIELDADELPKDCSQVWLAYLAAEIYGYADTTLIAITHNRGRQARILVRQMYECMKRAEYYATHSDDARLELLSWPWREKKFCDEMGFPNSSERYKATQHAIETITRKYPDVPAYAARHGFRERPFRDMVGDTDPKEYAFHYRRLSQSPHGSVVGMQDALDFRSDGALGIRFDSRLDDPALDVEASTMYLLRFLDILDQVLAKGCEEKIKTLDRKFMAILARLHPQEYAEGNDTH